MAIAAARMPVRGFLAKSRAPTHDLAGSENRETMAAMTSKPSPHMRRNHASAASSVRLAGAINVKRGP
jgi:hypothetical protein